eukprot:COSAG02_NODE_17216_length_1020_cov_4.108578_1_plen_116_part_10
MLNLRFDFPIRFLLSILLKFSFATLSGALIAEDHTTVRREAGIDARLHLRGHHKVRHLLRKVLGLRAAAVEAVRVLTSHGRVQVEETVVPLRDGVRERTVARLELAPFLSVARVHR